MRRLPSLPRIFDRFAEIGGVVDFAIYEDTDGSLDETVAAIVDALGGKADGEALRAIGGRRSDEATLFGHWVDPKDGGLIKVGSWHTAEGKITDPKLAMFDDAMSRGGSFSPPETGAAGFFAYAFSRPPYPLEAEPGEVQAIFSEIRSIILPSGCRAAILDWSSERLVEVSDYFKDGLDWWGVCLFSLHLPEARRLTIAMASTTD